MTEAHDRAALATRSSETGKCHLTWYSDGTLTKELNPEAELDPASVSRFFYEARISQLLTHDGPPFPFPRLLNIDRDGEVMRFEAIGGEPFGPKFPAHLAGQDLAVLLGLSGAVERYVPSASWVRRYHPVNALRDRYADGAVPESEFRRVSSLLEGHRWPATFAHGDLTPRNVLRSDDGPVLIDWEFAGWHPHHYDMAFLWVVLGEVPGFP